MTCDDIVKSLREECETCSENSVCRNGVNLAGLYCANSAAADLIENQQNHIRALLQANDALRQRWIPVTERLPEEHESIFAKAYGTKRWAHGMFRTISDEVFACVAFDDDHKTTMTLRTHDGAWALSSVHRGHVTHWMPLPEAPEEY